MPQEYPFVNKPLGRDTNEVWARDPSIKVQPDPFSTNLFTKEERESIPEDTLITTKTRTGWVTKARNGYWRFDADAPPSGQGPVNALQRVLKNIEERKQRKEREAERRGSAKDPESSAEKPRAEKQHRDEAAAATGEARAAGIADDIRQLVLSSKVSGSKKSAMLSQLRLWTYFDSEEQQEGRNTDVLHTGKYKNPFEGAPSSDEELSEIDTDELDGYHGTVSYGR
jgi:hypothetical protein